MHRRIRPRTRFWLLLMLVAAVGFGCSYGAAEYRYRQSMRRLRQMNAERDALAEAVRDLEDQLAYTCTDEYVQNVARNELNMLFPGEIRYVKQKQPAAGG